MAFRIDGIKKRTAQLIRYLKTNRQFVLGIIFVSVLGDVFYIPAGSDIRFFGFVGLYAVSSRWYRLKSRITFTVCLALLALMYVLFLTTSTSPKTERAAVWLVLFWIVGLFQQWKEAT